MRKREKFKSNQALALFLCGAVLLFSIGLAMARGSGGSEPYKTTDLVLTQGDGDYDLTSGISYDMSKYTLSVTDEGDFDINTPGTYTVSYALTPITGAAVSTPSQSQPVKPASAGETAAEQNPPAGNSSGAEPGKSDPAGSGEDPAQASVDPVGPSPEEPGKPAPTKPEQPAKPDGEKPTKPAADSASQPDHKPDAAQNPALKPDRKPDAAQNPAPQPDRKPDAAQNPALKPDHKPDAAPNSSVNPNSDPASKSKPAAPSPKTSDPDSKQKTKQETKPASAPKSVPAPAPAPASGSPSSQDSASKSDSGEDFKTLSASNGQDSIPVSQNLLVGVSGYGTSSVFPGSFLIGDASKSGDTQPESAKPTADHASKPEPAKPSTDGSASKPEPAKPSTDGSASKPEPAKPSTDDSAVKPEPAKPSTGDSASKPEPAKPSTDDPAVKPEPAKPSTDDPAVKPEPAKPSTDNPAVKPEPAKPSTDNPAVKPEPAKPSTDDSSGAPSVPEISNQPGSQAGGGTEAQAGIQPEKLEIIPFTRNVVVKPAVEYQDIRLDVSNGSPSESAQNAALLTGMKFDEKKYSVTVTDDGHFFADRIGEYKVSYELTGVQDGGHIANLERYVWVTAPGADFQAPPLTVDSSQKYDLFSGIVYDSGRYDLSLVDPNAFDPARGGTQRVMYRLTVRSGSGKGENTESGKADTKQAGSDGVTDQSVTADGYKSALTAAVFGREVTVSGGYFIHFDAPPLVVTQGATQEVNPLENVKATDERGQAVEVEVLESSQPNGSAAPAATPSAMNRSANPLASNFLIMPPDESGLSMTNDVTSPAVNSSEGTATPSAVSPSEGTATPPAVSPSEGAATPPAASPTEGAVTPPAVSPSEGTATPPAVSPSEGTATPSAVSPSEGTATPPAVSPSEAAADAPVLHLTEGASLPADLPAGIYRVPLTAVHPVTQERFTYMRMLYVSNGGDIKLYKVNGTGTTLISSYLSMGNAFDYINSKKGTAENYLIATTANGLQGYSFRSSDQTALSKLTGLNKDTTITITGIDPQDPTPARPKKHTIHLDADLEFPYSKDSSTTGSFDLKDINFDFLKSKLFIANGSKLTMDKGLVFPTDVQTFATLIGGTTSEKGPVNTNISVKSGKYYNIFGGNYNIDTNGNTSITVEAQTVVTNSLVGGSGGVDIVANPETGEIYKKYNQVGDSSVTVKGTGKGAYGKEGIYTLYAGTYGDQTGTSSLVIAGGSVGIARSGSYGDQKGDCSAVITGGSVTSITGGAYHSMGTSASTVTVNGASANVNSVTGTSSPNQTGDVTVTLEDGKVSYMSGALTSDNGSLININVNGGTLTGTLIGKGNTVFQRKGSVAMNLNSSQTIGQIQFFDQLNLKAGTTLAVTKKLESTGNNLGFNGIVSFGANSTLILNNSFENLTDRLVTTGSGASLVLKRQTDQTKAPLNLRTGASAMDLTNFPLTLKFTDGTAAGAVSGDQFIKFVNSPGIAVKDGSFIPPTGGYPRELFLWMQKGSVILEHAVGLQTVTSGTAGPPTFYGTVKAAMDAIGNNPGYYTVSIRKDNYQLTVADSEAFKRDGGSANSITFTSGFTIQANDPLESGEAVGSQVRRNVIVGSPLPGAPAPDLGFPTNTVVKDVTLEYLAANGSLFANGHAFTVGNNVEIISDQNYFPTLYGGSDGKPVGSTNLHLSSGKFGAIYGGGKGPAATVSGDVNVTVDGVGELAGTLYGGGNDAAVGGAATVQIQGGKLLPPGGGKNNQVIGGGSGTGGTVGSCKIIISGGTATGPVDVAGCDQADVNGDVSIDISKFGPEDKSIIVPAANVYGGGINGGQVKGSAAIQITDGKDYNVISGGGNPQFKGWPAGVTACSSVKNGKTVTLLGDVEAVDAVNFTNLNLGAPLSGLEPSTANVKIDGDLDSDPDKNGDYSLRKGDLNFYGGSVLNLTGKKPLSKNPAVRNISVEESNPISHLHIAKHDTSSVPMHLAGTNTSQQGSQLALGILGDTTDAAASGDQLLVFTDTANINLGFYAADSPTLSLITDEQEKAIKYGKQNYPQVTAFHVRPHELYKGGSGGANTKTLEFTFQSKQEDGIAPGPSLENAYVDTHPDADANWKKTGADPSPVGPWQKVDNLKKGENDTWTGSVTMDIGDEAASPVYYVHARTQDTAVKNVQIDVQSPIQESDYQMSQDGGGNYDITVKVADPVLSVPSSDKGIYTAAGLYQTGWYVGSPSALPGEVTTAALSYPMNSTVIHGIADVPSKDIYGPYEVTFHIKSDELGGGDLKNKVIYLFIKDNAGNTSQLAVSLSKSLISVKLPLRTGVVALMGGNSPRVEAPVCNVENGSQSSVRAEILGATILKPIPGSHTLAFTKKTKDFSHNEMNLQIASAPGSASTFLSRSVADFDPASNDPLDLGTMKAAGSTTGSSVDFTFTAMFDPQNIMRTSDWSVCQLSYRFTLIPPGAAVNATDKKASSSASVTAADKNTPQTP